MDILSESSAVAKLDLTLNNITDLGIKEIVKKIDSEENNAIKVGKVHFEVPATKLDRSNLVHL